MNRHRTTAAEEDCAADDVTAADEAAVDEAADVAAEVGALEPPLFELEEQAAAASAATTAVTPRSNLLRFIGGSFRDGFG